MRPSNSITTPTTMTKTATAMMHRLVSCTALVFATILTFSFLPSTLSFPDHLTTGRMGCLTDLSTDEVIMNNPVVAFADSEHQEVKIGWKRKDTDEMRFDAEIKIDHVPLDVTFFLVVPAESKLHDVQYVIETTVQPGVMFEYGGCDDHRRAHGRVHGDQGNKLLIEQVPEKDLQVWAGWAGGFEAVKLTDKIVLKASREDEQQKQLPPPPSSSSDKKNAAKDSAIVDREVEDMVEEALELEEAEETEREALQEELGDDDTESGIADMEERLAKDIPGDAKAAEHVAKAVADMMRKKADAIADAKMKKQQTSNKTHRDSLAENRELRDRLLEKTNLHHRGDHIVSDEKLAEVKKRLQEAREKAEAISGTDGSAASKMDSNPFDRKHHHRRKRHPRDAAKNGHPADSAPKMTKEDKDRFAKQMEKAKADRLHRTMAAHNEGRKKFLAGQLEKSLRDDDDDSVGAEGADEPNEDSSSKQPPPPPDLSSLRDLDFSTFRKYAAENKNKLPDRIFEKIAMMEEKQKKEEADRIAAEEAKKNIQYDDDEYADDKVEGIVYKKDSPKYKKNHGVGGTNRGSFLRNMEKKYEAAVHVDGTHHLFAIIFFILALLFVLQLCIYVASPKGGPVEKESKFDV